MQSAAPNVAPPLLTQEEISCRRVDRRYKVYAWLVILAATGAVAVLMLRENRRVHGALVLKALASLPAALAEVPLPVGREPPADRLHQACARLAAEFKMPVGELESGMSKLANRIIISDAEPRESFRRTERAGAYLFSFYLLPDPEDPVTLRLRETHASSELGGDAGMSNHNAEGEAELRAVLAMRRAVQGEDHPETLNTRLLLARDLFYQDRDLEAEQSCRELLAHYERIPPLAEERAPRELLAWMLSDARKEDEVSLRRWLLDDSARKHGADSLEAAEDQYSLATTLMKNLTTRENKEEAAMHLREAKAIFKKEGRRREEQEAEALLNVLKERGVP
ncbi:MAG TPA: tetratricopeptide repeat protein [Verrucomicrobiales bacterium]|nr:tetratricopeptide repeat protein [Verrucomicrobiales bacterium]